MHVHSLSFSLVCVVGLDGSQANTAITVLCTLTIHLTQLGLAAIIQSENFDVLLSKPQYCSFCELLIFVLLTFFRLCIKTLQLIGFVFLNTKKAQLVGLT